MNLLNITKHMYKKISVSYLFIYLNVYFLLLLQITKKGKGQSKAFDSYFWDSKGVQVAGYGGRKKL